MLLSGRQYWSTSNTLLGGVLTPQSLPWPLSRPLVVLPALGLPEGSRSITFRHFLFVSIDTAHIPMGKSAAHSCCKEHVYQACWVVPAV